jgi:hypothetical protein
MTQLHPIIGRSTTMFRRHFISTVALAAAFLALSASAAQAGPIGLGYTGQAQSQGMSKTYRSTYGAQVMETYFNPGESQTQAQALPRISPHDGTIGQSINANAYKVMSPPVDPANAQQVPVVVTQAQPVAATDSGFNWTAALLGAGIAALVLLLAGASASRMRPRGVAHS